MRIKESLGFGRHASLAIFLSAFICSCENNVKPEPDISPVHFRTATELTAAIRRGEITSLELLNLYLDRIEHYNDAINAVVALDIEAARARAAEADKALAQGRNWGPLHGLPVTVKDVFEVVGMPATSGDPMLKYNVPKNNAKAVQRLIDAGAIIFGKTNVPYHADDIQSYNPIYGTTNNPWDLSRTPGGSSGGSAAALAVGLTPLELGSDMGGSLRFPAHYTGVFGHKTTFGIVPRYGHIPPIPGQLPPEVIPAIPLSVVGPLARSADDLELALDVLTTSIDLDETDQKHELLPPRRRQFSDYRVAMWFTDSFPAAEIDFDVLETLKKAVEKLRASGLEIDEEARPDISLAENTAIWRDIYSRLQLAVSPLPEDLVSRQKRQQALWAEFFERYDVLLAPVAPTVAFPHDHEGTLPSRSFVVNGQKKPMLNNLT